MSSRTSNVSMDQLGQFSCSEGYSHSNNFNSFRGLDFVKDGRLNKGLSFTIKERQQLGILGLVPPAIKTIEEEIARCRANIDRLKENLDKYVYLAHLQQSNEKLFYRLIASDVHEFMPLVYTPVVGEACQNFSLIFDKPRGLYITIYDKGYIYEVLRNWPEKDVRAIVVTDGERILGLGDLGANGMGIPVGKLSLYSALAGIKPSQCLPITLDVGCNTEKIVKDPYYIGLRKQRTTGPEYDEFIEEFMFACVRRFGRNVLIQFEDFANHNAFRLLDKYRDQFTTFNDDIQGTASVALAGLFASLKVTHFRLCDNKIMFQGAGEAAIGIADLCVMAMQDEGLSEAEARQKIFLIDSKGLVTKHRLADLNEHKKPYAKDIEPINDLTKAVQIVKPNILIGASAVPNTFTKEVLQTMAAINDRPVIFALSNPTAKAECKAEDAYKYTDGRAIFASGSPFEPVEYNGQRFEPGQGNNSYIFPGVALGVICGGLKTIPDEFFIIAARTLADMVQASDLEVGRMYPPLQTIQKCSIKIAAAIMRKAYAMGIASTHPQPADIESFIECQMYRPDEREPSLPPEYPYPKL